MHRAETVSNVSLMKTKPKLDPATLLYAASLVPMMHRRAQDRIVASALVMSLKHEAKALRQAKGRRRG